MSDTALRDHTTPTDVGVNGECNSESSADSDSDDHMGYTALSTCLSDSESDQEEHGQHGQQRYSQLSSTHTADTRQAARIADSQLLSLERDYLRTIAMTRPESQSSTNVPDSGNTKSFLYDDDTEESEDDDCAEAESSSPPHGTANADVAPGVGSTCKQSHRGRAQRTGKKKSKSGGKAPPLESAIERRNRRLIEEAQLELMVQHIQSATHTHAAGTLTNENAARTRRKVSTAANKHSGRPGNQATGASAQHIKIAMAGFELPGAPEWAQSSDISKVVAEFYRMKVGDEATLENGNLNK